MAKVGKYEVIVKEAHIDWGEYRNPTNRNFISGESYVKIPSKDARRLNIKRGDIFTAYFQNGYPSMRVKASGNGPYDGEIQFAKQFEGIGKGACKAFTPWYHSCDIRVGDRILVEIISRNEVVFSKI